MVILAIDTSTEEAGVAVARDGEILAELAWRAAGNHSKLLTKALRDLLDLADLDIREIDAVIVARGPGSFSGIRVGVSEAKGLAMALDVPLVGIATLDVIAFQESERGCAVWAIIPAGRGQVFAARYQGRGVRWARVGEYQLLSEEELATLVQPGELLAGPGDRLRCSLSSGRAAAPSSVRSHVRRSSEPQEEEVGIADGPWRLRRPGFLAELGRRYLAAGGESQLHTVEPLYLRLSAAEETRDASRQEK